jgi:predicted RNA-binding protein associated with RNAse of E/G family
MELFEPGRTVVRRNVFRGKVRSAWPLRVVHDTGEELAWACLPGTELTSEASNAEGWRTGVRRGMQDPPAPARFAREMAELLSGEWSLGTSVLEGTTLLGFQLPDVWFSVLLFFQARDELSKWYVNFEHPYPYRRTPIGVDTWDLTIDLVFKPDGTHRWKDVDEYGQARRLGLITDAEHTEIERAKEQAFARFERREGPFDERWLSWRRDPAWPVPVLPDDATTVPAAS